jgi:hypothetical protein
VEEVRVQYVYSVHWTVHTVTQNSALTYNKKHPTYKYANNSSHTHLASYLYKNIHLHTHTHTHTQTHTYAPDRQWYLLVGWKDNVCFSYWLGLSQTQMLLELVSIHSVATASIWNYLISPLHYYIFLAHAMILINFFPNDCQKLPQSIIPCHKQMEICKVHSF